MMSLYKGRIELFGEGAHISSYSSVCCTWASPFWWLNTQMLANWFMKPFGRIQKPLHLETGQNKDKKTLTF